MSLAVTWITSSPLGSAPVPLVWTAHKEGRKWQKRSVKMNRKELKEPCQCVLTLTHVVGAVMETIVWILSFYHSRCRWCFLLFVIRTSNFSLLQTYPNITVLTVTFWDNLSFYKKGSPERALPNRIYLHGFKLDAIPPDWNGQSGAEEAQLRLTYLWVVVCWTWSCQFFEVSSPPAWELIKVWDKLELIYNQLCLDLST